MLVVGHDAFQGDNYPVNFYHRRSSFQSRIDERPAFQMLDTSSGEFRSGILRDKRALEIVGDTDFSYVTVDGGLVE